MSVCPSHRWTRTRSERVGDEAVVLAQVHAATCPIPCVTQGRGGRPGERQVAVLGFLALDGVQGASSS